MPTAVLMITGQIDVMKMTKIADGALSRKAASEMGSQASGGTVRSTWKIGSRPRMAQLALSDQGAQRHADDCGEPETDGDALQAGEHAPAQTDVLRPEDEEGVDDQVLGFLPDLERCRQGRLGPAAASCQTSNRSASTIMGGTTIADRLPRHCLQPVELCGALRKRTIAAGAAAARGSRVSLRVSCSRRSGPCARSP